MSKTPENNNKKDPFFPGMAVIDKYEKSLKESEERFRMLVELASDAFFVMDAAGNFIQTNSKGYLELGYSKEEFLKMNIKDVIPSEDLERVPLKLDEIQQGKTFFSERSIKRRNGEIISVEASLTRFPDGNIQAILRNITKRKKAEHALVQSQESYKTLIEYIPDGIFIHDERGEVVFANPAAMKIMGIGGLEDLKSKHIFDHILPEYHSRVREQKSKMERGEQIDFMIAKVKRTDGTTIEVESKPIDIVFDGKRATLVVYHDISDQRRLEKEYLRAEIAEEANKKLQQEIAERKKAEEELLKVQKYTRSIIEESLDIICASDKEGRITEFNKAAEKQFGYTRDEVIGKKADMLYKDALSQQKKIYAKLKESGMFVGEILNLRKSGEEFISFLSASILHDEAGNNIGTMGVSRDITEIKKTEERIKQSLKEKEVLLKEVHHRVKNNLQVISSILNLQSSYVTDKQTIDLLRESQNRIKSMSFIHEILYQTRDFSNINFSEYVVNLTRNLMQSYSSSSGVELKLDVGSVFLNLDLAIPCGLIINELVSNAIKYAFPDKTAGGEISIGVKQNGDFIKINIGDNGTGFPPGVDYRNTESLGLQLVMTLVDQIDGDITLNQGKGTNFSILFENKIKKTKSES